MVPFLTLIVLQRKMRCLQVRRTSIILYMKSMHVMHCYMSLTVLTLVSPTSVQEIQYVGRE